MSGNSSSSATTQSLRQTSGDDHSTGLMGGFEIEHLLDHRLRLLPRLFDESARIDDHEVRAFRIGHKRITVNGHGAQHPLAVDEILGTSQRDKGITAARKARLIF